MLKTVTFNSYRKQGTVKNGFYFDLENKKTKMIGHMTDKQVIDVVTTMVGLHATKVAGADSRTNIYECVSLDGERVIMRRGAVYSADDNELFSLNVSDVDVLFMISELLKALMTVMDMGEFCQLATQIMSQVVMQYNKNDEAAILKLLGIQTFRANGIHIKVERDTYINEFDGEEYEDECVSGSGYCDDNLSFEPSDLDELFLTGTCAVKIESDADWGKIRDLVTETDRANLEEVNDIIWNLWPYAYVRKNRLRLAKDFEGTGCDFLLGVDKISDVYDFG